MRLTHFKFVAKNNLRWVFAAAKWASNSLQRNPSHSRVLWGRKLPSELRFWEKWVATRGLTWPEEFARRTNPDAEMEFYISRFVKSEHDRILDVGAGPLTVVGTRWQGNRMDVTAVDPLADAYNELLDRYKIAPPVRTQSVAAEELTHYFPPNSFDLSFARNCLDHSYDPFLAIEQMLCVTKQGGKVVLLHEVNEGANELYRGLHQWNFSQRQEEFLISAPAKDAINVSQKIGMMGQVSVALEGGWLLVVIRKT